MTSLEKPCIAAGLFFLLRKTYANRPQQMNVFCSFVNLFRTVVCSNLPKGDCESMRGDNELGIEDDVSSSPNAVISGGGGIILS